MSKSDVTVLANSFSNELLVKRNELYPYKDIIEKIVLDIFSHGIILRINEAHNISELNWSKKNIWLSIKKKGLQTLWDLFHEYGHIQSGEKPDLGPNRKREEIAWNNALFQVKKEPKLHNLINDFITYKEECLKTYPTD